MFVLNSLLPVIVLIILGAILKRKGLTNATYLQTSDRLVYFIFFPLMLFWKIGSSSLADTIDWGLSLAALSALAVMFVLSLVLIVVCRISSFQAGSFAQGCYRFNTYIGMAVILSGLGEEAVAHFGVLIAIAIPIINVAAVTTLIWYSQEKMALRQRTGLLARALISNPLIIGCLSGILYSRCFTGFPQFIGNCLSLVSMLTLPLALLSIGGSLTFSGIRRHVPLALLAAAAKLVVFPLTGFFFLRLFGVDGVAYQVGMIFFALPTSTAIYVLSSQMNSDPDLASSTILMSTLLSFPVLSLILLL